MRRRAILAMLAALLLVGTGAACGQEESDGFELTPLTALQGRLEDADGRPIGGSTMVAFLLPNQDEKAKDPNGGMHEVGRARTGADGRFAFAVDPATVPAGFRQLDDDTDEAYVGLVVTLSDSRGKAQWAGRAYTAGWSGPPAGATSAWRLTMDGGDKVTPSQVIVVFVPNGKGRVERL